MFENKRSMSIPMTIPRENGVLWISLTPEGEAMLVKLARAGQDASVEEIIEDAQSL